MPTRQRSLTAEVVDPDEGWSLPAWTYSDAEYFEVEAARIFRPSWQVVCHQSDIARPGEWRTLDLLGESIVIVRGRDLNVRAFTNVCRHRGSRILDGSAGCASRLVCPYHGWTYDLDGRVIGVPRKQGYAADFTKLGLVPVDLESWRGFLFVRLAGESPSVAEMMGPYEQMVEPYRLEELRALGRLTLRPRTVNWKNVADNYSDGLHIEVAHPGLTRLFGRDYGVEAREHVDRMWGSIIDRPSSRLSERLYQKLLPAIGNMPPHAQRQWLYFKLWPNTAFDIYPDQVDFMQFLPVSRTETLIREISYALPDDRREMRAARYLNWRINRQVNAEDAALIARVQAGMGSKSFSAGPLSVEEVCLRSFCAKVRRLIPEARLREPPAPGWSRRGAVASVL